MKINKRRTIGVTLSKPMERWIRQRCEEMFSDQRCVSKYVEYLALLELERHGRMREFEAMIKTER